MREGDFADSGRGGVECHVGFCIGEIDGAVLVLDGNQSSPGQVSVTKFPKAQVLGYRRLNPTHAAD
jgi:hypothetical protein